MGGLTNGEARRLARALAALVDLTVYVRRDPLRQAEEIEGLAEFVGREGWTTRNEMVIRDAVVNDMIPPYP